LKKKRKEVKEEDIDNHKKEETGEIEVEASLRRLQEDKKPGTKEVIAAIPEEGDHTDG